MVSAACAELRKTFIRSTFKNLHVIWRQLCCVTASATGLLCGTPIWLSACTFFSFVYFVIVKSIAP